MFLWACTSHKVQGLSLDSAVASSDLNMKDQKTRLESPLSFQTSPFVSCDAPALNLLNVGLETFRV